MPFKRASRCLRIASGVLPGSVTSAHLMASRVTSLRALRGSAAHVGSLASSPPVTRDTAARDAVRAGACDGFATDNVNRQGSIVVDRGVVAAGTVVAARAEVLLGCVHAE